MQLRPWRILAVDDEPMNLEILSEYLDDPGYAVTSVENGALAWEAMEAASELANQPFDLVILDRMMPVMDGMSLLRMIKKDDRFKTIPVIMQTAASSPEQIREGMEAGAWYYLTKPYGADALISIVSAALSEIAKRNSALEIESNAGRALSFATKAEFRFSDVGDISALVAALSELTAEPPQVAMGLTELLVNAVEHGNLGITYAEKKSLRLHGGWDEEIAHRRRQPNYRDRQVKLKYERHDDSLVFTVMDEGEGFDWQRYLDFDPDRAFDPNGRGIAMARNACFSDIAYQGCGNVVVARLMLKPTAAS